MLTWAWTVVKHSVLVGCTISWQDLRIISIDKRISQSFYRGHKELPGRNWFMMPDQHVADWAPRPFDLLTKHNVIINCWLPNSDVSSIRFHFFVDIWACFVSLFSRTWMPLQEIACATGWAGHCASTAMRRPWASPNQLEMVCNCHFLWHQVSELLRQEVRNSP